VAPEPSAHAPDAADPEGLRVENEILRRRLAAAEALAAERAARIEDLLAALTGLPHAWERWREEAAVSEGSGAGESFAEPPTPAPSPPMGPPIPEEATRLWIETRRLRDRLELEHFAREVEALRMRRARKRRKARS